MTWFNTNKEWHKIFAVIPVPLGTFNPETYKREGTGAGNKAALCYVERRYTGYLTGPDGTPIQEYRLPVVSTSEAYMPAKPDGYLYTTISGSTGFFLGELSENTIWQVERNRLKLTPFILFVRDKAE